MSSTTRIPPRLREWLAVILLLLRTDVTTWGKHEALLFNTLKSLSLVEARSIVVDPLAVLGLVPPHGCRLATPFAEGVDNLADV